MDLSQVYAVVGFLGVSGIVALATSTIKSSHWSTRAKTAVAMGLSVVGGVVVTAAANSWKLDGTDDLAAASTAVFATTTVIYNLVLRNTGLNGKLTAYKPGGSKD